MITKNEEKAIRIVTEDIKKNIPIDSEILIVDSSKDQTPVIAESLGVRVIRQFPPQGYGKAMDLALRSAKGNVVVTLDCDNTYPVDQIPVLYDMVLNGGYDIVDTSRLKGKPKAMPMINYLANWGFALLASILFLQRITDLHSGMRAYRKSMIDSLDFDLRGMALPVELLLKPLRMGFKLGIIFIEYKERIGSSTMEPLRSAWWTLRRILNVRFGRLIS
ncbi:MAG: glycosyltransferase family 2 protein [Bacteroidota bacterium]